MKHLIFVINLIYAIALSAQSNYESGMQKAFYLWQNNKLIEAEQLFERIASAEKNEWLPHYYVAQINSLKSWNEDNLDVVTAQLNKAQKYLDMAGDISKDNFHLMVMQAQIYTNWIALDGMTYGMKYSSKVTELYNRAYSLAPENPIVVLCKADWEMGSARYFGKDTQPFCKDVKAALVLFENYKPEPFYPNWGRRRAAEILESCNN
jgi:tetratricopeptide (TPR) repeat protein